MLLWQFTVAIKSDPVVSQGGGKMSKEERQPHCNKYDVEMAKITRDIEKSANLRANLKTIFKYGTQTVLLVCIMFCTWRITGTLPEILTQMSEVIKEWRMAESVHYIVTIIFAIVICLQRKRLKRFTIKTGDMRHKIEYNDSVNVRSGLDPDGTSIDDENED